VYRSDYFIYGQVMKFLQRDAVRIASSPGTPANVAFRNPDGTLVLIVANPGGTAREVGVTWREETFTASLRPKSVATFRWKMLNSPRS
jgi:glucosylceramidase